MIAYLNGKLVHKEATYVIVEVGGVGYEAYISFNTFLKIKELDSVKLLTYYHIRENSHLLYGFGTVAEKLMFQNLISVNGVGANTAMLVLSALSPSELKTVVIDGNVTKLQTVKGIGAKSAQRIILELKDKLRKYDDETPSIGENTNTLRKEALSALTTLGIPRQVAERSISQVIQKSNPTINLEDLVKQAIRNT